MTSGNQGLPSDDVRLLPVERDAVPVTAAQPTPEVDPVVDFFAKLIVLSRAWDRFALAVAQRVEHLESGGRR